MLYIALFYMRLSFPYILREVVAMFTRAELRIEIFDEESLNRYSLELIICGVN